MKRLLFLCLAMCFALPAFGLHVERHSVSVTTAADGSATVYSPVITGRVLAVIYVKGTFDNGADFTITAEATAEGLWTESDVNASKAVYPRIGVHDAVGVAATLNGTQAMRDALHLANDRVKIVIAQGGNAKAGTFIIIVG
jgi:hypothetical protein